MEEVINIEQWYTELFEKPQFNWYSKNDTYFDDIKLWKQNLETIYILFTSSQSEK